MSKNSSQLKETGFVNRAVLLRSVEGKKGTTLARARRVKADYEALLAAMPTIGGAKEGQTGLGDLAQQVADAEVLLPDLTLPVSASGKSVYPGDMVCITQEPEKLGEEICLTAGGAKLLSVGDNAATGKQSAEAEPVGVVFTQDGKTWLKLARWKTDTSSWQLGPTQLLLERELEEAVCLCWEYRSESSMEQTDRYFAIFYREDGAGMVQFWGPDSSEDIAALTPKHRCTDIWTDEDPGNLCGAYTPAARRYASSLTDFKTYIQKNNLLTLAYAKEDGSFRLVGVYLQNTWNAETQESEYSAGIWADKTILPGEYTGVTMREGKHEDFTIAPADGQEYANGAWSLTAGPEVGAVWLNYPGQDGNRYILELWAMDDRATEDTARDYKYEPGGCRKLLQANYQPCGVGLYGLGAGGFCGQGPYFLGIISRLSGPNQRASVGVEGWAAGYDYQLTPLWFGEENQSYRSNIGLLSTCRMGDNKEIMAVGYAVEGTYRIFLLTGKEEKLGGPAGEICQVGVAARLAESHKGAALVFQRGDSVYLQQVGDKTVVVPTTRSRAANAQAVTGGRPGQEIRIRRIGA